LKATHPARTSIERRVFRRTAGAVRRCANGPSGDPHRCPPVIPPAFLLFFAHSPPADPRKKSWNSTNRLLSVRIWPH